MSELRPASFHFHFNSVSAKKEEVITRIELLYFEIRAPSEDTACVSLDVSVDESFAVSSGLLNLVVVLGNDVKQHSLDRDTQRRRFRD